MYTPSAVRGCQWREPCGFILMSASHVTSGFLFQGHGLAAWSSLCISPQQF